MWQALLQLEDLRGFDPLKNARERPANGTLEMI
ncbi:MAG: hypothetical protein ACI9SE_002038 [Neolewinella sp.]|jgi:hypothetical protein